MVVLFVCDVFKILFNSLLWSLLYSSDHYCIVVLYVIKYYMLWNIIMQCHIISGKVCICYERQCKFASETWGHRTSKYNFRGGNGYYRYLHPCPAPGTFYCINLYYIIINNRVIYINMFKRTYYFHLNPSDLNVLNATKCLSCTFI